ncbi:MAG: F0F1 ATP synthase subunit B [Saprospiraceae bacterium]|nr:F0F1 ATP synthase subunit B [Saprospiraceae bacterium]MCF8251823.1 F0F1 ATP synthase subunit B [Saprospiraceae bacterium]MCF8281968.1 F0F1 ATP synthase subunit B [Bacteroidales bacterium]MCF8313297.1 F0F1 ATP synthase subunit B [Saprospiraceae bacterium]MCF8441747.1 F0F1 ATP synthase subunit B [Saprospiraceae bacterium]
MIFLIDFTPIKPDFGLIFWTTIIFLIFWLMIGKFAFRPIAAALKKRESDIQGSLDEAKRVRQEMQNLKSENEALLIQAREERAQILKEAKEAGNRLVDEAKGKAKVEAQKIVADAKEQIEHQKMAAITDLKNQLGAFSIQIAEKVIRRELSTNKEQEGFVNDLVKEIKLN